MWTKRKEKQKRSDCEQKKQGSKKWCVVYFVAANFFTYTYQGDKTNIFTTNNTRSIKVDKNYHPHHITEKNWEKKNH